MTEKWQAVWGELLHVFGSNGIGLLFLAALVYLFFAGKHWRRWVAWPALVLCVLVTEPHIYQFLQKYMLGKTYWRLFWIIPVMPVIACAAVDIVGRIRRKTTAALALGGILFLIAGCGSLVYGHSQTSFSKAENAYKIPQRVVDVCQFLLELDEQPRIVAEPSIYLYARQYSADIQMMYGRDEDGYIHTIDDQRKRVADEMSSDDPDLAYIHDIMEELDYSYLIKSDYDDAWDSAYYSAGFEKIGRIDWFGVFRRL